MTISKVAALTLNLVTNINSAEHNIAHIMLWVQSTVCVLVWYFLGRMENVRRSGLGSHCRSSIFPKQLHEKTSQTRCLPGKELDVWTCSFGIPSSTISFWQSVICPERTKSLRPESNQWPMDVFIPTLTVHRSANWAITRYYAAFRHYQNT